MGAIAYIAMGSNVGDKAGTLMRAAKMMDCVDGIEVRCISQMAQTEPAGPVPQPRYVNAVAEIETTLEPLELLKVLHQIERGLGRDRPSEQRWGPRTCDLDILLYGELVVTLPELTIPHPQMHRRRFVLEPLVEIAPEARHPVLGLTAAQMLAALRDEQAKDNGA